MEDITKELAQYWELNGINSNNGIYSYVLRNFETDHNVRLPNDMYDYFLTLNGMPDDELDGLTKLWPIKSVQPVNKYLRLYSKYASTEREVEENVGVPFNDPLTDNYQRLRECSNLKESYPQWLLPEVDKYFIFGDYNIGGCFWAIKLSPQIEEYYPIISIYDHLNKYKVVINSFTRFIDEYINKCAEVLI